MNEQRVTEPPTRAIACVLGLSGFGASVLVGLASGNEPTAILWRALAALPACYILGLIVGWAIAIAVREHIERVMEENPIPEVPDFEPPSMDDMGTG